MGINVATLAAAKAYTNKLADGLGAVKGAPCQIKSITEVDNGHEVTFSWIGASGAEETSSFTIENGVAGAKGDKGDPFTYNDFTQDQLNALKGADGISPTIVIDEVTDGHSITITDASGTPQTFIVKDGIGENNVIESIKLNGAELPIDGNKSVDIAGVASSDALQDVAAAVGDIATIEIESVTDLVTAINLLYNSSLDSITYSNKELTIKYKNKKQYILDITPIITDINIGELKNINDTNIADKQVLAYDIATQKYIPLTIDLAKVLKDSKDYTDKQLSSFNSMDAIVVDAKPAIQDGIITYIKDDKIQTTENSDIWFYYTVDSRNYQTLFVDGVEFTVSVDGDINFKDYVTKSSDLTDEYTGTDIDKTKVPTIAALDALYTLLTTEIGNKANKTEIPTESGYVGSVLDGVYTDLAVLTPTKEAAESGTKKYSISYEFKGLDMSGISDQCFLALDAGGNVLKLCVAKLLSDGTMAQVSTADMSSIAAQYRVIFKDGTVGQWQHFGGELTLEWHLQNYTLAAGLPLLAEGTKLIVLPANGGNSATVNGHTVKSDVPENAVFTDTVYDDTEVQKRISDNGYGEIAGGKNLAKSYISGRTAKEYNSALTVDVNLKPSTKYTISFIGVSGHAVYLNEFLFNEDTELHFTCTGERQYITATTLSEIASDQKTSTGWLIFKNQPNNTVMPSFTDVQIEEGTTATEYEPYFPSNKMLAEDVDSIKNDLSASNAGAHNSVYRGKYLGNALTTEQWNAIKNGTFEDLYIGDYWTIGGVAWRIAGFDYWLNCGDTQCTKHHVVIVPDSCLYNAQMNTSSVTTGAYIGSEMYMTNLAQAKTTINNAFGSSHILSHREYLPNAIKADADPTYESAGSWYDSTVELMNERMVCGADVFHNIEVNGAIPINYTIDNSQLPLFALEPSRICNHAVWWLRDVVSAAYFAAVSNAGIVDYSGASYSHGVRPAFAIKG